MGVGGAASSFIRRLLQESTVNKPTKLSKAEAIADTIFSHLRAGRLRKAVDILYVSPFPFPFSLYSHLFQVCSSSLAVVEARKVESHLISNSDPPPTFLLNRAIETYGKCGCLSDARELFDEMPHRDGGSWNAMITSCVRVGCSGEALTLFKEMYGSGVSPNEVTLASVLGSCGDVLDLRLSRQIHGLVVKHGFVGNVILESSLVDMYGKCGVMDEARRMFDEIESPNSISWNVIVRRYLEAGDENEALNMFSKKIQTGEELLTFTVSNALVACSRISALEHGKQIHSMALKINHVKNEVVSSSLVDMYVKCSDLESASKTLNHHKLKNLISLTSMVSGYVANGMMREARELFDQMAERNIITWNVMLKGYVQCDEWDDALGFVFLMLQDNIMIDYVSIGLILNVCAGLSNLDFGRQVHGYVYRHELNYSVAVGNSLLDMYGKCGSLKVARILFQQLGTLRDTVSWNTLMTCYARCHMSEEAMLLLSKMMFETIPNEYTFATIFASCANIFALNLGKEIHGFMIRKGYEIDDVILGSMVDMYSKCRLLDYAIRVFKLALPGDIILWNTMILGCCHHGKGPEALELFDMMIEKGLEPDHVTFQGVLFACIVGGYVECGTRYFESMSRDHHVMARLEHYESMVELYSRHGALIELEEFVKLLPFEPTISMVTKVFDACREYGHLNLRKWAAEKLNQQECNVF